MDKIVAIGPISPPINGPGIKNRHLREGLIDRGVEVKWIDTHKWKHPKTLLNILWEVWHSDAFLLSAGTKVRLLVGPILAAGIHLSNNRAALLPVGSRFPSEMKRLPNGIKEFYLRVFSSFDIAFCESERLTNELSEAMHGRVPVETLPNLRPRPDTSPEVNAGNTDGSLRVVYVGRIKKSKGLSDLLHASRIAKSQGAQIDIDIYGHFLSGDPYQNEFEELCEQTPNATYVGKIPDGRVIETLGHYDIFAFPSYYEGEGIPGAVIEALFSGCGIVASNWNYNDEIVNDGANGILFEPRNVDKLAEILVNLYTNPYRVERLKKEAWNSSNRYSVESVISHLMDNLQDRGW